MSQSKDTPSSDIKDDHQNEINSDTDHQNDTISWIEIAVTVTDQTLTLIEEALTLCGALAITYQDDKDEPIFEPTIGETPLWSSTRLTALFAAPLEIDRVITHLQRDFLTHFPDQTPPQWRVNRLEEQDWERVWLNNFKPLFFEPNFWVVPSWCTPPVPDAPKMLIDPGLAFGTGSHETTALCLSWLAAHSTLLQQPHLHLIDYGCGSGILAIASLILGASTVTAIDIDPQAIMATRQNSALNNIDDAQLITRLTPANASAAIKSHLNEELTEQADVIVANILCEPLLELSLLFKQLLKPGGRVLFSGILAGQADILISAYEDWIQFDDPLIEGEWALLTGISR